MEEELKEKGNASQAKKEEELKSELPVRSQQKTMQPNKNEP
jgi:hypothetical protein